MNINTLTPLPTDAFDLDLEDGGTMNVVVLYEDATAAQSASQLLQRLSQKVDGNPKFRQSMWKFDHLILPQLEGIAAADTAGADLIIICSHDGNPLPEAVKILLERWTAHDHAGRKALVALLIHGPSTHASLISVEGYLRELSKQGDTAFFAQSVPSIVTGDSQAQDHASPFPWRAVEESTRRVPQDSHTRWGLNE